jgi:protease-4
MAIRKTQYARITLSGPFREGPLQSKSPLNRSAATDFRFDHFLGWMEWARSKRRLQRIIVEHREDFAPRLFAGAEEVRRQLLRLRRAGKEIYFVSSGMDDIALYIASAADHVILHPTGTVRLRGLSRSFSFFKARLDREGVIAYVHRRGAYKSAGDSLRTDRLEDTTREEYERYLELAEDELLRAVAAGFSIPRERLEELQRKPQLLGTQVREAGLCTEIRSLGDVEDAWREEGLRKATLKRPGPPFRVRKPTEDLQRNDKVDGAARPDTGAGRPDDGAEPEDAAARPQPAPRDRRTRRIAVVVLEGTIVQGRSRRMPLMGQALGSRSVVETLEKLRRNKRVAAVVVRVNSPGGSAVASDEMRHELAKLADAKPLYVSMSEVAGSGGYWISTVGRRLFAGTTTLTGSIGVITLRLDASAWFRRQGLTSEAVKTADMADYGSISRPPSNEEIAVAEQEVDDYYREFLERVAAFRKVTTDEVDQVAQGRVWAGQDAGDVGLIDERGGVSDVLEYARRDLAAKRLRVEYHPQARLGLLERLIAGNLSASLRGLFGGVTGNGAVSPENASLTGVSGTLRLLQDPQVRRFLGGPLALIPELWDHSVDPHW